MDLFSFFFSRAYRNEKIGHRFFWNLRAEVHINEVQKYTFSLLLLFFIKLFSQLFIFSTFFLLFQIAERYCLLLEGYIRGCGSRRAENLLNQHELMERFVLSLTLLMKGILPFSPLSPSLTGVARKVKEKPIQERKPYLHELLGKVLKGLQGGEGEEKKTLMMPLDQRLESTGLVVEKCKSMDSKQVPLWLVFQNADPLGENISVILKVFFSFFLSCFCFLTRFLNNLGGRRFTTRCLDFTNDEVDGQTLEI